MHIVLINGPAGSGKNTLAAQTRIELFKILNESKLSPKTLAWRVGIEEFKQTLIDMLFQFAETLSVIPLGSDRADPTRYEELKRTKMFGLTGREWQITWADAMRAKRETIFIDAVKEKVANMLLDVALIPDCGFQNEMFAFDDFNHTRVYLDGWNHGGRIYGHGERFDDDIRICLRNFANTVNPTPAELARIVFNRMLHAHDFASAI